MVKYGEIIFFILEPMPGDARPNDPTSPMARWVMERPPPAQMMEELQPMMKAKLLQLFGHRMHFLSVFQRFFKGLKKRTQKVTDCGLSTF